MRRRILYLTFSLLYALSWGQSSPVIKGTIVDATSLVPLNAVSIQIDHRTEIYTTDERGYFEFTTPVTGEQWLTIYRADYLEQRLKIQLEPGSTLDLGVISLVQDLSSELQLNLISLTEDDLDDDSSSSDQNSGLLQASKDAFQKAAAFNWGQARFRIRGLDNKYGKVLINGLSMNKRYDGRPQWSNWGGLNDATRQQEFTMGTAASDYSFGSALGLQAIHTQASNYRKGTRITLSLSNTNYQYRTMITHASGLGASGWAYALSASYRGANQGYFEGTSYEAPSFFASVEKQIQANHRLHFTGIYAKNTQGKTAPLTDEVQALMGSTYNSNWGWQAGKKRNSRNKVVEEPLILLTHNWNLNNSHTLTNLVAYQFGKLGNSRLNANGFNSPDPTYYRKLPSYSSSFHDAQGNYLGDQPAYVEWAEQKRADFLSNSQINWEAIYRRNIENGESLLFLSENRTDDRLATFQSNLNSQLTDHIRITSSVTHSRLNSSNFNRALDMLEGGTFLDINRFLALPEQQQSDLNHIDRRIGVGDKFEYNYELLAGVTDVFAQIKFNYNKILFYHAQQFSHTLYQRHGRYRNGIYPENSLGKSAALNFNNYSYKSGLTYLINSRHILSANTAYISQAPDLKSSFSNARINNAITPDLQSEEILSSDLNYVLRTPKIKARLSTYYSEVKNSTQISFYYGSGLGVTDLDDNLLNNSGDAFVTEILSAVNKRNYGAELGFEYQFTPDVKITANAAWGQFTYANNPNIKLHIDNVQRIINYGTSYLKNYKQAAGPQIATSLGLEYRDPKFWWIGANVNYLDQNYIHIAPIKRTDNFVTNPKDPDKFPFENMQEDEVRHLLKQQKLAPVILVNAVGGKSWRIGQTTLGLFVSANNLLGISYKTGGYEQARTANYQALSQDQKGGTPSMGNKYFYGYGRNFYLNLHYTF